MSRRTTGPDDPRDLAPPGVEDQMLRDWAAVGIRRLERHLARFAEFEEYLQRRGADADPTGEA
jgi:hypothetical protein